MREVKPYRPSIRQMENFERTWCHTCRLFGQCEANKHAAIGIVPPEWLRVDGKPLCTSYQKGDDFLVHGPIADHILNFLATNSPATREEIESSFEQFKHSTSTIFKTLEQLEHKQLLRYSPSQRLYRLTEEEAA